MMVYYVLKKQNLKILSTENFVKVLRCMYNKSEPIKLHHLKAVLGFLLPHIERGTQPWGGHSHKDRGEQAQLKKRPFGTPWQSSVILDQTKRRDQKWASLAELYQKHERALSLLE